MHSGREAACRCPRCKQYFCRECVTEHQEQLMCSACHRQAMQQARAGVAKRKLWQLVVVPVFGTTALTVTWLFFYSFGQVLLTVAGATSGGR
jgi:hypothetical protein